MSRNQVVRVTEKEFELDNGAVYPHPVPLDTVPTVEEFQEIYDQMTNLFEKAGLLDEATRLDRQGV
jgi:hypothetical protein